MCSERERDHGGQACELLPHSEYSWLRSAAAAELVKSERRRNPVNKEDRNERRKLGQEDLLIRQRH